MNKARGPGLSVNLAFTAPRADANFRTVVDGFAFENAEVREHRYLVTENGAPEDVRSLRIHSTAPKDADLGTHLESIRQSIARNESGGAISRLGKMYGGMLSCYVACNDDFPSLYLSSEQINWLGGVSAAVDIDVNIYSKER